MPLYSDFVRDGYGRPIPGALAQLFAVNGSTLIDSDTTGADGQFTLTGPDAKCILQVSFGGESDRSMVIVGNPPEYVGPQGPSGTGLADVMAPGGSLLVGYNLGVTGAQGRSAADKMSDIVCVLDFIPSNLHAAIRAYTNTTDLTAYVNAGFAYVDALPSGGALYFPAGEYMCEIDASNKDPGKFQSAVHLYGDDWNSSRIVPPRTDAVLLNMVGRNSMTVSDIQFYSANFSSQCGIYLARGLENPNCNNNRFFSVKVEGNFNRSCVVSIAAESSRWLACWFRNSNDTDGHREFWTGTNPANYLITLPAGITPVIGPNTDNRMWGTEFHCPYSNSRPVALSSQGGWIMTSCAIISGDSSNVHQVTYTDTVDGYFNGPAAWVHCHFEVFGTGNTIHWLDPQGQQAIFQGIDVIGGNTVISPDTALFDYDRTSPTARPILQVSHVTTIGIPVGVTNVNIYAYAIIACNIFFRPGGDSGFVHAFGFIQKSHVDASDVRTTNLADTTQLTISTIAAPTSGTYGLGTFFRNMRPQPGSPTGWYCTAAGTIGTLSGVTATTTAGSNVITVNTASGLYTGAAIDIAGGVGGPWVIQKIVELTVYLGKTVTNGVSGAVTFSAAVITAAANL